LVSTERRRRRRRKKREKGLGISRWGSDEKLGVVRRGLFGGVPHLHKGLVVQHGKEQKTPDDALAGPGGRVAWHFLFRILHSL
jgi:hypothetical protein